MKPFLPLLTRRGFCKGLGASVGALALTLPKAEDQQDETIVRSNRFLSIGIHRKTGKAFVEEKSSEETWIWNWRQIRAANLSSFSADEQKSLTPITPYSIQPSETVGPCRENYGSWPYDQQTDAGYRDAMFAEFSTHDRVVGCEQNKDWAIPYKPLRRWARTGDRILL